MTRETPAILWREDPQPRGVFQTPQPVERKVYGTLRSVGYREHYEARAHGLEPEVILVLAHDFEYRGETRCRIGETGYRVLRTYVTDADTVELTLGREVDA